MVVAYHTHEFQIPTASKAEVAAGTESGKVVTPATLGSSTAFATAAQGALADTALQPLDPVSELAETATAKIMTGDERAKLGALPDNAALTASLDTKFDKTGGTLTGGVTMISSAPSFNLKRTTEAVRSGVVFSGADGYADWTLWQATDTDLVPNGIGFYRRNSTGGSASIPFQIGYTDDVVKLTQRPTVGGVGVALQSELTGSTYKGTWDATTNSPAITAGVGTTGDFYITSVAGTQSITGSSELFSIGDQVRFNGTAWQRIPNFDAVNSVAGRTGAVVLSTGDISGLGTAAVLNTGRAIGNVLKYEDFGGYPALITDSRFIFNKSTPTLTDVWNVGVLRDVSSLTGGTSGFVNAALRVDTTVNTVTSFEWGFLSTLTVNGAGGGEHCAGYFQGVKNGDNALWSLCTELREYTTNPTTGSLGIEVGMFVTGTDAHGSRHGIDISIGSANNGTGTNVVSSGIRIGPSLGDSARGQFTNGVQISGKGICGLNLLYMDISYADRLIRLPNDALISWRNQGTNVESAAIAWHAAIATWQRTGMLLTTAAPTGGTAGALPAQPVGYINEQINGTMRKIPYYH